MKCFIAALMALAPFSASADAGQTHLYLDPCHGFRAEVRAIGAATAVSAVQRVHDNAYVIGREDACSTLEFTSDEPNVATLPSVVEGGFSVSIAALGRGRVSVEVEADERPGQTPPETVIIPAGLECQIVGFDRSYHLTNCRPVPAGAR